MNGAITMLRDRTAMLDCPVALVTGKPVWRVLFIQLTHHSIPCRLGEDRGSGNAQGQLITPDQRNLGEIQFGEFKTKIGQQVIREERHGLECTTRGQPSCGHNAERIDFIGGRKPNRPTQCTVFDARRKPFACLRGHLLGVARPGQGPPQEFFIVREDDRGSRHRPGKCTPSSLVQARDAMKIRPPQPCFEMQIRSGSHNARAGH